jgi:SOS-response transcriptional repressor LexA
MYLTARQRELYEFLQDYIARQGEAPTYQEIGRALRLKSTNAVAKHLKVLEHAGLILRRRDGQRRPCQIRPERLAEAMTWLNFTSRAWEARFDRLARFLHDTSQPNDPKGTNHGPEK